MKYTGHCFCENVTFIMTEEPLFTQHCHCNKCRDFLSCSENPQEKEVAYATTVACLFSNFSVHVAEGALSANVANGSTLHCCPNCRSLIYGISNDPEKQAGIGINFYNFKLPAVLPESFKAVRHIWYDNRKTDEFDEDGLEKYGDAPDWQGGTGRRFK